MWYFCFMNEMPSPEREVPSIRTVFGDVVIGSECFGGDPAVVFQTWGNGAGEAVSLPIDGHPRRISVGTYLDKDIDKITGKMTHEEVVRTLARAFSEGEEPNDDKIERARESIAEHSTQEQ
jgi:hypothetical protein